MSSDNNNSGNTNGGNSRGGPPTHEEFLKSHFYKAAKRYNNAQSNAAANHVATAINDVMTNAAATNVANVNDASTAINDADTAKNDADADTADTMKNDVTTVVSAAANLVATAINDATNMVSGAAMNVGEEIVTTEGGEHANEATNDATSEISTSQEATVDTGEGGGFAPLLCNHWNNDHQFERQVAYDPRTIDDRYYVQVAACSLCGEGIYHNMVYFDCDQCALTLCEDGECKATHDTLRNME